MGDEAYGWQVRPFEGLMGLVPDGVRLGDPRTAIAGRLADAFGELLGEVRTFRKAPWATGLCDHYVEGGLICFFDDEERLVYLEAFDPAPVFYGEVPLTGLPYDVVVSALRERGVRLVEGDSGVEAPDAGFHLTAPYGPDDDRVDRVGLFRRSLAADPITYSEAEPVARITTHELVSGEGTAAVRLGAHRKELGARLGPAQQSVPEYGGAAMDWYFDHGLVLFFDADDRLTSLVITYTGVTGEAWFRGVQLLDRPYGEVVADLEAAGVRIEHGELAGRAPEHGFTLLLRGYGNPAMPVGAVVFSR
ncbi:hypothetical protein [Streptomyces chattanoogensis]|uniref:hypothetical protein n=1 Tax=Streptomyces chattanoogensis TaxID=66876 RepID=UPI0005D82C73|nr:hypothetical protein T261_2541 [Streptomyces lydicus]